MASLESLEVERANRKFIRESMRAPLLDRDREIALARRWRNEGDVEALHEIIGAYTRLVISAASHYRKYGLPLGDLIQEGLVGLMMAAARFDPERQTRFSTYATWWVRSAMQGFILRNWSIVRTGTTAAQKALFFNMRRLRARIDDVSDGPLGEEARTQIADELRVSLRDVEAMEGRLAASDQSLNAHVADGADDEWQDLLVDPGPSPEEIVAGLHDAEQHSRWLAGALGELSARERQIIAARRLRDEPETLAALGRRFGISKERVRQIEHGALAKIRRSILRRSGMSAGERLFGT